MGMGLVRLCSIRGWRKGKDGANLDYGWVGLDRRANLDHAEFDVL